LAHPARRHDLTTGDAAGEVGDVDRGDVPGDVAGGECTGLVALPPEAGLAQAPEGDVAHDSVGSLRRHRLDAPVLTPGAGHRRREQVGLGITPAQRDEQVVAVVGQGAGQERVRHQAGPRRRGGGGGVGVGVEAHDHERGAGVEQRVELGAQVQGVTVDAQSKGDQIGEVVADGSRLRRVDGTGGGQEAEGVAARQRQQQRRAAVVVEHVVAVHELAGAQVDRPGHPRPLPAQIG
jgi:hypothetical protein